jgi:hypothetical protein
MCDFSIPFQTNPEALVERANKAITGMGGTFTGDTTAGTFHLSTPVGSISGSYTVTGQNLGMHIDEKPFFITCSQIEAQLKKALLGN